MMRNFALYILSILSFVYAAHGQESPFPEISADNPVEIEADEVDYFYDSEIIVARGDVIIKFSGNVLKTEEVKYNRDTGFIEISNPVSIVDEDGNEYNAQSALISSEWADSSFSNATLILKKEGVIFAEEIIIIERDIVEGKNVKYTMCELCNNDFDGMAPLWSVEGETIVRDNKKQKVMLRNAFVKVLGVPLLYTPYIRFPTPGAEPQTGFLSPILRHDSDFGGNVKLPFYVRLAPDSDLLIKPWLTSRFGNQISLEYRKLYKSGYSNLELSGARTDSLNPDKSINKSDNKTRFHIKADGKFQTDVLGHTGVFGYNIMRVNDPFRTYLKKYDISEDDILNSKVYFNNFNQNEYFTAEVLQFQGLRTRDSFKITPQAYPRLNYFKTKKLRDNLVWDYDIHFLNLYRSQGRNVRRLGLDTKIFGHKYEDQYHFSYFANLKLDYYHSEVNNAYGNALEAYNKELGVTTDRRKLAYLRAFPKLGAELKFPFYSSNKNKRFVFEPRASFIVSPKVENKKQIINEDSQSPELQINNVFLNNLYKGRDQVEDGTRISYGIRTLYYQNQYRLLFEAGQLYLFERNTDFGNQSGLTKNFSDYVTKVQLNYKDMLSITNKLRWDQSDFSFENNETNLNIHYKPIHFTVDFYGLGKKSIQGTDLQFRNEVHTTFELELPHNFSFKYFTKNRVGSRAESEKKFIAQGMNFMYKGKCLEANFGVERKYTSRNDLKPTTEYELRFNVPLY